MLTSRMFALAAWAASGLLFVACDREVEDEEGYFPTPAETGEKSGDIAEEIQEAIHAEAGGTFQAAEGAYLEGDVQVFKTNRGLRVAAQLRNAPPGQHGFHIHEKGDCSDIAGKSMGGHLNPNDTPHALPWEGAERHLGDLGNLDIGDDGQGHLNQLIEHGTLTPDAPDSLLGKAVVIHSDEDQGRAKQPAGDSGKPIACAVIQPS